MTGRALNAGDRAEREGAQIGLDTLNLLMEVDTQAHRLAVLQRALLDVADMPRSVRATGGFACALVAVIERGLGLDK